MLMNTCLHTTRKSCRPCVRFIICTSLAIGVEKNYPDKSFSIYNFIRTSGSDRRIAYAVNLPAETKTRYLMDEFSVHF